MRHASITSLGSVNVDYMMYIFLIINKNMCRNVEYYLSYTNYPRLP